MQNQTIESGPYIAIIPESEMKEHMKTGEAREILFNPDVYKYLTGKNTVRYQGRVFVEIVIGTNGDQQRFYEPLRKFGEDFSD